MVYRAVCDILPYKYQSFHHTRFSSFQVMSHFAYLEPLIIPHRYHYCFLKSVRIRSYSGPYFPAFEVNTDQNNSEYGHAVFTLKKRVHF